MASKVYTPNLNSWADAIDRLCVELLKLSYFEQAKRDEHGKENPDPVMIAKWDNLSRDCCEYRSQLKNFINQTLAEIVNSGEYKVLKELRTFRAPKRPVEEIIDEVISKNIELKDELIESLVQELNK